LSKVTNLKNSGMSEKTSIFALRHSTRQNNNIWKMVPLFRSILTLISIGKFYNNDESIDSTDIYFFHLSILFVANTNSDC
jgi:hypothetical protein